MKYSELNNEEILEGYIVDFIILNDNTYLNKAKTYAELLSKNYGRTKVNNNLSLVKEPKNGLTYITIYYKGNKICTYKYTLELFEINYTKNI